MSAATSHAEAPAGRTLDFAPFKGGGGWVMGGGLLGLVLVVVSLIGASMNPDGWYSYLMAFAYWAGLAFASVILLMMLHATHARWVTVLRRPIEAMSSSIGIFLLLFIPLAIGLKHVYV